MEVIVISLIFFAIVLGGAALAALLMARAIRADQRYVRELEQPQPAPASEPAWVAPHRAAA